PPAERTLDPARRPSVRVGWSPMRALRIGWRVGSQNWAFHSVVSHLVASLRRFDHAVNEDGDVTVLMSIEQLAHPPAAGPVVMHLDSKRSLRGEGPRD